MPRIIEDNDTSATPMADHSLNKRSKDVWRGIANLCHMGRFDLAHDLFPRLLERRPDDGALIGAILRHLIDAEAFAFGLELVETHTHAMKFGAGIRVLVGRCLEGVGRVDEALAICRQVSASAAETADLVHLRGLLAYDRGDTDVAIGCFERAIELNASFGPAMADLGLLRLAAGDARRGVQLITQGFSETPANATVATHFHQIVCQTSAFDDGEVRFRQAIKNYPNHKKLHYLLIDLLIQQHKHADAMRHIETAVYRFGTDDGILEPALKIRNVLGPMKIADYLAADHTVSLCMIVKDEAHCLARCLYTAKPIVDEMIIVDTGSSDRTVDVATCFGAKVIRHPWADDFSEARNISLQHATGKWILVLDADEVIAPSDHRQFKNGIKGMGQDTQALQFITRNYCDDVGVEDWHPNDGCYETEEAGTGWSPSIKVRLFANDERIRFVNPIHELVEPAIREIGHSIGPCAIPIHHYGKLANEKNIAKKKKYFSLGLKKNQQQPDAMHALVELAIQAGEVGEYKTAIELWKRVIEKRPDFPKAYFNLSFAYIQREAYRDGFEAATKAIELAPDLKEARLNSFLCQIRMGRAAETVSLLDAFLIDYPDNPMAMGLLAVSHCLQNNPDQALPLLETLSQMEFDCVAYLREQAQRLIAAGRGDDARALLRGLSGTPYAAPMETDDLPATPECTVTSRKLTLKILDWPVDAADDLSFRQPMDEIIFMNGSYFQKTEDKANADFIVFPFALDRVYQQRSFSDFHGFLKGLPDFARNPDRYVFFLKDDIGRRLELRSVVYRANHHRDAMDLNSITLPYFVDDHYRSDITDTMRYQVNFVGTLITHVYRAYMLLPFLERQQLSIYNTLLEILGRSLSMRKDGHQHDAMVSAANTYAKTLFPLVTTTGGVTYYFNITVDQYARFSPEDRQRMKDELVSTMNASVATLCPRGVGTQSIRFFETLSLGRLPIVISDRYVYPLDSIIDYDRFVIRISENHIHELPETLTAFFSKTAPAEIQQMGKLARKTWQTYFSPGMFENYLYLTLSEVLKEGRGLNRSAIH